MINGIVWATAVLLTAFVLVDARTTENLPLRWAGWVAFIVVVASAMFDHYMWRQRLVRRLCWNRPLLAGTWKAELHSTYEHEGERWPPVPAYAVVQQTFSEVHVTIFMENGGVSESGTESLRRSRGRVYRLEYLFRYAPTQEFRDSNPLRDGACVMRVQGPDPTEVGGEYWTSAGSRGDIRLWDRRDEMAESFTRAAALCSNTDTGTGGKRGGQGPKP